VRAVVGRASDFYGPGGVQSYFEARFWGRVLRGKSAQLIFNPDTRHTWHFIPDVAAGLAALGQAADEGLAPIYLLPAAPAGTSRQLVGRFAAALGRPVPVSRVPRLVISLMAVFVPLLREVLEMDYQWDEDFVVDDGPFRERFGLLPTPPGQAAAETVAWARSAYGAGPARAP
jgi:nucleoside-diphosphate-sugar epimerase